MNSRLLFTYLLLIGFIGCNKEDKPEVETEECSKLHYGRLKLINETGNELAYNFPNSKDMERYGVLPDTAMITLDKIYSGWINLSSLNIQTGEVKKYLINVVDCNETLFVLR